MTFWMLRIRNQLTVLSCLMKRIQRQEILSVQQLISTLPRENNIHIMRYQLSRTYLNHKIEMLLTITLHRISSIFNYCMIPIRQPNRICRIEPSIPSLFMVLQNIFSQTPGTLRSYCAKYLNTSRIRKLILANQTTFQILKIQAKLPGTFYLPFIIQDRTHLLLIRIIILSDRRQLLNSP